MPRAVHHYFENFEKWVLCKYALAAPDCYPSAKLTKLMLWYKYPPKQAAVGALGAEGKWLPASELWPECFNTEFSRLPVNMLHQEVCTVNIDVTRKKRDATHSGHSSHVLDKINGKQRSRSCVVRKPQQRHARAEWRTKITVSGRNPLAQPQHQRSPSQLFRRFTSSATPPQTLKLVSDDIVSSHKLQLLSRQKCS